jgi:hypothetical protein
MRRIGDQNHGAAKPAKPGQRIARVRRGGDAIVNDAPDVAQHDIVVGRERGEMTQERGGVAGMNVRVAGARRTFALANIWYLCNGTGNLQCRTWNSGAREENSTLVQFFDYSGLSLGRYGLNSVGEFHTLDH